MIKINQNVVFEVIVWTTLNQGDKILTSKALFLIYSSAQDLSGFFIDYKITLSEKFRMTRTIVR